MVCPLCGKDCYDIGCNGSGVKDCEWWQCSECDWDDTQEQEQEVGMDEI